MAIIILIIALLALFIPQDFLWIEINWINYLLMFIMFGMGMVLKADDFKMVFSNPKDVLIGTMAQFILMPLLAFALGKIFNLDTALFIGLILVGACPGGTASNVITYLAKGNLALSVSITAFNTLLAPIVTPFIIYILLHTVIKIPVFNLFIAIINIVILPVILGLITKKIFGNKLSEIIKLLPASSILAISLIVASIVSHNADKIINTGFILFAVVILHNISGYIFGYIIAKLTNMNIENSKAISIEVGMQNSGLATSLAITFFSALPLAALPGAIFSVFHNLTGSVLAWYFSKKK
ncbi:MAG: bile acid:sodium symporter family protein [Candidatus Gastranaerophilales bacterium]|nr:bile acid:sodium symporter family protein [Candidatus Gastranaerophilales bacterium]